MNFTGGGKQNEAFSLQVLCSFTWARETQKELIYLAAFNMFLSITAVLRNILILVALRRVSSLHPPSKLLFRCLATTDLCIGLITEPLSVVYWMSLAYERRNLCRYSYISFFIVRSYTLCSVSLLIMSAIGVDRLLALLLRYRQVVTLMRTYLIVGIVWIMSAVASLSFIGNHLVTIWYGYLVIPLCLSSNLNCLVHKDFPQTPPSSDTSPGTCPTGTTKPTCSAEHRAIQKSSV